MRPVLVLLFGAELLYVLAARILAPPLAGNLTELELLRTGARLLSIAALVLIHRRLPPATAPGRLLLPGLLATGMFLAPVLVGDVGLTGADRHLYAVTSVAVGWREELAYRGILQRVLAPRFGLPGSLLLSNLAFVAYHWGAQPFTAPYVLQLLLCGLILGVVYHASRSLLLVVTLHAIYDAIDSYTPLLHPPLPYPVCLLVLVFTLAALVAAVVLRPPVRSP
jgi:membrane protease YdiL (CAAX protease family)